MTALSATKVAKLFAGDTRSDISSEAEKMQYANRINALVVKFIWLVKNCSPCTWRKNKKS